MLGWIRKFARKETQEPLRVRDPRITPNGVDTDARKVIYRLRQNGCPAYIVGGAVRDLYLGLRPKDFDIVTSAPPNDIRRLFRNSIIIGRRFQLVHIRFHNQKVIETATFRSHHGQDVEGHVRRDNVFGTEREDAFRRDFTMNALFYDPEADQIIDYVGGLADLKAKVIRCIGNPHERMVEDPVRILRAIKFSAMFGLGIESSLENAIRKHKVNLRQCNSRRLQEEFIKILKVAKLVPFYRRACDYDFFDLFLPGLAGFRKKSPEYMLRTVEACDRWTARADVPFSFSSVMLLMLWPLVEDRYRHSRDLQKAVRLVFEEFQGTFQLSKMEKLNLRPLFYLVERMDYLRLKSGPKTRHAINRLLRFPEFHQALALYREITVARDQSEKGYEFWKNLYREGRRPMSPPTSLVSSSSSL